MRRSEHNSVRSLVSPFLAYWQSDRLVFGSVHCATLSREEQHGFPESILRSTRTYHLWTLPPEERHERTTAAHRPNLSSVCILKGMETRGFDSCLSFHQAVKESLERKRADVVELYQPMTESMKEIHGGLVQCMSTTLAELKRSHTTVVFLLIFILVPKCSSVPSST